LTYLGAVLAAACFMGALQLMGVVPLAGGVVDTTRAAARTLKDVGLSDADKERLLRKASASLLGTFVSITVRAAAALGAALLPLAAFQLAGLADVAVVAGFLATWPGLLLASVVMTVAYLVRVRP
jgi:hypothetical protein